jgi:hypothetical protein
MATINKNGKAYDSADVSIELLGNTPNEVYEIAYNTEQQHQKNFALGSHEAKSWSQGNIDHNGSITLSLDDGAKIEQAARKLNIELITKIPPFDIVIQYFNEFNQLIQDVITCKFQTQGRQVGGEMALRYQYTLFVLAVKYSKPL